VTTTVILIALAYGLLAAMLLVIVLSSAIGVVARLIFTVATLVFIFVSYMTIGELRGWPSDTGLPGSFQLLWGRVVEPDPLTQSRGHVFLWVEALDADNYPSGWPRSYMLPYSAELAELVNGAVEQIEAGETVAGALTKERARPDTADRMAGEVERQLSAKPSAETLGERYVPFDFGDLAFGALPVPVTPDKPQ